MQRVGNTTERDLLTKGKGLEKVTHLRLVKARRVLLGSSDRCGLAAEEAAAV